MSTLLAGAAFAQKAPAPAVPDAAATVKAVCKDGTPFEGTTLRGAWQAGQRPWITRV